MGCGCKKQVKNSDGSITQITKDNQPFFLKIIAFLFVIVFSPLITIAVIVITFRYFFFSSKLNMTETTKKIASKFNKTKEEEEEIIFEEEEEYEDYNIVSVN